MYPGDLGHSNFHPRNRNMQRYRYMETQPATLDTSLQATSEGTSTPNGLYTPNSQYTPKGQYTPEPSAPGVLYGGHPYQMQSTPTDMITEGTVLEEEIIETQVTVPVKRTYEETIMKPETVIKEVIENQTQTIREKIVKYAVPEYEYVEKPVLKTVREERLVDDVRDVYVENVVFKDQQVDVYEPHFVPKTVEVEVPTLVDQLVEREVSIPRYKDEVQYREEKVLHRQQAPPVIQEVEVPQYKTVEIVQTIVRNLPVAVDHIIHQTYALPQLDTEFEDVEYPVYVAKFVEIAVPAEYLTEESILECESLKQQVEYVCSHAMPSVCVIEDLADRIRQFRPMNVTDPAVIRERLARSIKTCQRKAAIGGEVNGTDLKLQPIPSG